MNEASIRALNERLGALEVIPYGHDHLSGSLDPHDTGGRACNSLGGSIAIREATKLGNEHERSRIDQRS